LKLAEVGRRRLMIVGDNYWRLGVQVGVKEGSQLGINLGPNLSGQCAGCHIRAKHQAGRGNDKNHHENRRPFHKPSSIQLRRTAQRPGRARVTSETLRWSKYEHRDWCLSLL